MSWSRWYISYRGRFARMDSHVLPVNLLSGAQAPALYAISLLVVFLCLAALYESWSVPFGDAGCAALWGHRRVTATDARGLENDSLLP